MDEAVAALGVARAHEWRAEGLAQLLLTLQRELFVVGAELATALDNASKLEPSVSKVTDEMVKALESRIDDMVEMSALPDNFVVPGECDSSAALDLARSVVRRAERAAVALRRQGQLGDIVPIHYLNRLSDLLFAAARLEETSRNLAAPPSRKP